MLTSGQQRAVDLIAAGANVFLTGEGGTGKSFAISKAVSRLMAMGKDVLLCAPTGVAAQNIGGSTIHSAFGFDFAPKVADAWTACDPRRSYPPQTRSSSTRSAWSDATSWTRSRASWRSRTRPGATRSRRRAG